MLEPGAAESAWSEKLSVVELNTEAVSEDMNYLYRSLLRLRSDAILRLHEP